MARCVALALPAAARLDGAGQRCFTSSGRYLEAPADGQQAADSAEEAWSCTRGNGRPGVGRMVDS